MSEAELAARLAPRRAAAAALVLPEFVCIHRELAGKGMTLMLLWQEYQAEHAGEQYNRSCAAAQIDPKAVVTITGITGRNARIGKSPPHGANWSRSPESLVTIGRNIQPVRAHGKAKKLLRYFLLICQGPQKMQATHWIACATSWPRAPT
ncbi:MAG: hypothetical protein JSR28_18130 [Proteobacteria bacterium]|nr:hypothetical protein [Pseudomonadota bacterium]